MNNKKIRGYQLVLLYSLIIQVLFLGIETTLIFSMARNDGLIAIFIAFIITILFAFILIAISSYKKDLKFAEKLNYLFPKVIAKSINIILIALTIFFISIILFNLCVFVNIDYLPNASVFVLGLIFMLTSCYIARYGKEIIARVGIIASVFSIVAIALMMTSLTQSANIDNLRPFLYQENNYFQAGLLLSCYTCIPLIFIFIFSPKDLVKPEKFNISIIFSVILGFIMMAISVFIILTVLGAELASLYQFPEYYILKKVDFFGYIQNIENLLSLHWIFIILVSISMAISFIFSNLKQIVKVKKPLAINSILISITLITAIIATNLFQNDIQFLDFIKHYYLYVVYLPFCAILLITLVAIIIKGRVKTKEEISY